MSSLPRWLTYVGFFGLILLAYAWRLPRGVDMGDEPYYANFYVAWLRSPIGETDDLAAHQPSHLLLFPFVQAYAQFVPDLKGLMLFLRELYALFCVGTVLVTIAALRPFLPRLMTVGVAASIVVFVPFGLPAPSYNTLGMLFAICTGCCFLRLFQASENESTTLWIWGGGIYGALQTLSYPTLVFVPFALWLSCYVFSWRNLHVSRRFQKTLLVLIAGHLAITGLIVGVFGVERLRQMLEFSAAYGANFSIEQKLARAKYQLLLNPDYLLVCGAGLVATLFWCALPSRRWGGLVHAISIVALVSHLLNYENPSLYDRSHDVVFFIAIAGLPVVRHLFRSSATRGDQFLALWYLASLFGGLLTSWTSSNSLINFPVGAFGAIPVILIDWFRHEADDLQISLAPAMTCAFVLFAFANGAVIHIYGETAGYPISVRIKSGPYARLVTTPERANQFETLRTQIAKIGSPHERVTVLGQHPGLYLFTSMKMQSPHSWPLTPNPTLAPILEHYYADPSHLPETVLWYAPPAGAHPVQRETLEKWYSLESTENQLHVFRRRDLSASGSSQPMIEWGNGFWPEERNSQIYWRLARESADLDINTFSSQPRKVRIRSEYHSHSLEPARLKVTAPGFERDLEIVCTPREFDLSMTLPPGKSTIHFDCTAKPISNEFRSVYFTMLKYRIEIVE